MPYDKKTREALQTYYETHDFTGSIPAFDDKKYTPAQLQIYAKAKKFFAQSWLKLLPQTGNKRSLRNFSKNSAELSERRRRGVHCGYGCRNYGRCRTIQSLC